MIKYLLQQKIRSFSVKASTIIAFTLAEVLITLLIIGVVASLVIPALINETNKAEYVTKLQKESAVLQQAFKLLVFDVGGTILNNPHFNSSSGNDVVDRAAMNDFATKLNVVKNCGSDTGCWYTFPVKTLGNSIDFDNMESTWGIHHGKAVLADGAMIAIDIDGSNCSETLGSAPATSPLYQSFCGTIYIDINGASGPNQIGRDFFAFWITKTGIYPAGIFNDDRSCVQDSKNWMENYGCTAKVLSERAMNY